MRLSLLLPLLLLLGACAGTDAPQVEVDPAASSGHYTSFSIVPIRTIGHRQDLEERFDTAVRRALEAKGYRFSAGAADLKVIYALGLDSQVGVEQRPLITSTGAAYSQVEINQDENARLALRILDSRDDKVLLQAQLSRQLHDPSLTQDAFDQAVARLLAEFPPRR